MKIILFLIISVITLGDTFRPLTVLMDFPDYRYTSLHLREVELINKRRGEEFTPGLYSEMFFSDENALRIDTDRTLFNDWRNAELISELEYYCSYQTKHLDTSEILPSLKLFFHSLCLSVFGYFFFCSLLENCNMNCFNIAFSLFRMFFKAYYLK